jgi:hypothetical protein
VSSRQHNNQRNQGGETYQGHLLTAGAGDSRWPGE